MNRKIFIFALSLIALAGSLVTAFALRQEKEYQLRGYANPAQDSNLPFYVPRLGVNAELTQYSGEELPTQFERMQAAHINWIRQNIRWDEIEPNPGEYHWDQLDTIVEVLNDYPNLKLIAVIVNTPFWAHADPANSNPTTPPEDPSDFGRFTAAFAGRYGHMIDHYQIWDEPNLTEAWGDQEPRPAAYVAMLTAAYQAIHGSDLNATVISGALAPTTETGPKNISDLIYLADMYRIGAKDYMDAVAAKPYGFESAPSDRSVDSDTLNFSRIIALREEMIINGDAQKAIWASNWGWNSLPSSWTGSPSIWGAVSAADQITYTLEALNRAEREWPWMAGMTLQHWQPDAQPDDPIWGFALIDHQNNPTPLWHILTEQLISTGAQNGLFAAVNPYAKYSGVWTFGDLGADIGWVKDSQFDFNFSGSDVSLLLRQDNYVAYLYPTIDGHQANAVPRDSSGNAYIVLKSSSLLPELNLIPVGRDLGNSDHTLHVVTDRGWDRWALAGFGVSQGDMAAPYNRQISIAWLTAIASGISLIVASAQLNWAIGLQKFSSIQRRLSPIMEIVVAGATSIILMISMYFTWSDNLPNIFRKEPIQLGLVIATAGFIQLEPGFVLTLLAAFVLFIVIYNHLYLGLVLTIFWSPFFLFPVELYDFAFPVAEVVILITTLAWLLHSLVQWSKSRKEQVIETIPWKNRFKSLSTLDYLVAIWVFLGIISLLWSDQRDKAITELRVLFIEPTLFYIIFRSIKPDKRQLIYMVNALLVAGFAVAAIGLLQFVQGQAIITAEDGARRLASVYGSPNNAALFLGRCIPFLLAFTLVPTSRVERFISAFALAPVLLAVALTQSVGAIFIGVPVAVITVILLALGKRGRWIVVVLVLVGIAGFIFSLQSPRFARALDFSQGTNFYRLRVWESAINIIQDHPITGLGLDQFLYAFRSHYIRPDAWQEPNLSHPHNIVLDFWVRLGISGVALLILFQVVFWRLSRSQYAHYKGTDIYLWVITIGAIGSMTNLLSHGLIDNSVYVQDLVYVFILLLGIAQMSAKNMRAIDAPPV